MGCDTYIKHLDVVDSTNSYARAEASRLCAEASGKPIIAVVADFQTAGRGQRGNSWQSQQGSNLLLSIIVSPCRVLEVKKQFLLSQAAALAMHRAMKQYGIDVKLKWPNDIYVGNNKLAGILVEIDYSGLSVEQAIVGIGLNVNQCEFHSMDRVPISMKMLLDKEFAVDDVLEAVLNSFEYYYAVLLGRNRHMIAEEYKAHLLGLGKVCDFVDSAGHFKAVIEGVEPTGELILRRNDGIQRYMFKEVELLMAGI